MASVSSAIFAVHARLLQSMQIVHDFRQNFEISSRSYFLSKRP